MVDDHLFYDGEGAVATHNRLSRNRLLDRRKSLTHESPF